MEERDDMMRPADRTWGEYRRLILKELERINDEIVKANVKIELFRQDDIPQIKTDIALLKLQMAAWTTALTIGINVGIFVLGKVIK